MSLPYGVAHPLFVSELLLEMVPGECDLLDRLNRLRPTSVSLGPQDPSGDARAAWQQSVEDTLAFRLENLRKSSVWPPSFPPPRYSPPLPPSRTQAKLLSAQIRDECATGKFALNDMQTDEQSLEDLLVELGSDNPWELNPDDPKNIYALLKEAKEALPSRREAAAQKASTEQYQNDDTEPDGEDEEGEDEQDEEEEAAECVEKLLAAVGIDDKYGSDDDSEDDDTDIKLPSAPSTVPALFSRPIPPAVKPGIDRGIDLEARFGNLGFGSKALDLDPPTTPTLTMRSALLYKPSSTTAGLNLPSTPTSNPSSSKKPVVTAKVNPTSNLPTYTDEEIDSWCCSCEKDGIIQCLGCDGDLYCPECFNVGHGDGPLKNAGHTGMLLFKAGPDPTPKNKKKDAAFWQTESD